MPAIALSPQRAAARIATAALAVVRVRVAGAIAWPLQWPHQYKLPVPHS